VEALEVGDLRLVARLDQSLEARLDQRGRAAAEDRLLAEDVQSINSAETKGKQQLMGQVQFFWKLIPDLKWEPQQMVQEGNTVVVRSIATGSPRGDFMGLTLDGTRSFRVTTIDMHTFENGKIKVINHVEEWMTAIKQLKA